jgi:hypothetical protein
MSTRREEVPRVLEEKREIKRTRNRKHLKASREFKQYDSKCGVPREKE